MAIHHLALAPCGFFTNAPPAAVQFAASHMHLIHLKRREVLGDGKQPFNGLGVVLQGNLQAVDLTLDGREAALLTATLHETFGHANLLAAQPVALTWVAASPSTSVAVMDSQAAQELMTFPEMALGAARLLAQDVHFWAGRRFRRCILSVHGCVHGFSTQARPTHLFAFLRMPSLPGA